MWVVLLAFLWKIYVNLLQINFSSKCPYQTFHLSCLIQVHVTFFERFDAKTLYYHTRNLAIDLYLLSFIYFMRFCMPCKYTCTDLLRKLSFFDFEINYFVFFACKSMIFKWYYQKWYTCIHSYILNYLHVYSTKTFSRDFSTLFEKKNVWLYTFGKSLFFNFFGLSRCLTFASSCLSKVCITVPYP